MWPGGSMVDGWLRFVFCTEQFVMRSLQDAQKMNRTRWVRVFQIDNN